MSKSLNFVVSIKLDRRSVDVNGNHPIKLRVWNRASKRVKMYSCNKFSDPATFEKAMNHKATVKGDTFVLRTYLERVLSNATDVLEGNVVKSHEDFEKFMKVFLGVKIEMILLLYILLKRLLDSQILMVFLKDFKQNMIK
ncbi:MAG: hypothetical protein P8M02_06115 [Flavobacteriaceae bacterium]|nr:hypothetical protein [Flavobacteriaceae bacterium]